MSEKILNITAHYTNHNKISSHTPQDGGNSSNNSNSNNKGITSAVEDMEKLSPSSIAGGNAGQCS